MLGNFKASLPKAWVRVQASHLLIKSFIPLHEKFLQIDWLRAVVFQLNLIHVPVGQTNSVLDISFFQAKRLGCGDCKKQDIVNDFFPK